MGRVGLGVPYEQGPSFAETCETWKMHDPPLQHIFFDAKKLSIMWCLFCLFSAAKSCHDIPNLTCKLLQSSPAFTVAGLVHLFFPNFIFSCPTIYKLSITLILHNKLIKLIDLSDEWSNLQFFWTILSLERSDLWDFHQHLSRMLRPNQAFFSDFRNIFVYYFGVESFQFIGFWR